MIYTALQNITYKWYSTVPTSTKPWRYLSERLAVNKEKKWKEIEIRDQCNFLMLFKTMAKKWYKIL